MLKLATATSALALLTSLAQAAPSPPPFSSNVGVADMAVGGVNTQQIKDSTTYGVNGGVSVSGGTVPGYANCFWNDTDSCTTINVRIRERVFVGNGVLMIDNQTAAEAGTFLSSSAVGANWIPRDSQFLVMHDRGMIAIAGVTQNLTSPVANADAIGVAGYAMNNAVGAGKAWAGYFEGQHNPGTVAGSSTIGVEIDCKNSTATNSTADPFTTGNGCYGLWMAGGGGSTYGPATPNPADAAILIRANATAWNEGVVIQNGALSGVHAIQLPNAYNMEWYSASANMSANINSIGTVANDSMSLVFKNNGANFVNNALGAAPISIGLQRSDAALSNASSVYAMDAFGNDNAGTPVGQTWARVTGVANTTTGGAANVGQFLLQTLSGASLITSMALQPNLITFCTGSINTACTTALAISAQQVLTFAANSFTANGAVATALTSLGPTGSHTTVQEWFSIKDSGGTLRYIPAF